MTSKAQLIGRSTEVRELMQWIEQGRHVLILGSLGIGKSLLVDTHGQARGTFTDQASLDLNLGFPAIGRS